MTPETPTPETPAKAVLQLLDAPHTKITPQNFRRYLGAPDVRHVMIDAETMDTRSTSIVMSIGVACMDKDYNIIDSFEFGIDWENERAALRLFTMSWSTMSFWLNQSETARQRLIQVPKIGIEPARRLMGNIARDWSDVCVWSNGAAFDVPIIENLFDVALNEKAPWEFWNVRCFRTIKSLYRHLKLNHSAVPHGAREDAVAQALFLKKCLARS